MDADPDSVEELTRRATEFLRQGRPDEAVVTARSALARAQATKDENSTQLISALAVLAHTLAKQSSALSTESFDVLGQAVDLANQSFGPQDVRIARFLNNAALTLLALNRIGDSVATSYRALECADRLHDSEQALSSLRVLTNALVVSRKYAEGLEVCARLYEREEAREGEHIQKMIASYQVGLCLLRAGQKGRAQFYLERAKQLQLAFKPSSDRVDFDELLKEARES